MEIEVSDNSFEKDVIANSKKTPVLADFWASWCMPCKMLSPVLAKIAEEYKGKLIVAKLNVDDCQKTAMAFQIRGIPAVKLFINGKEVDEFVGSQHESIIKKFLEKNGVKK